VQLAKVYDQILAAGADLWAISPQTLIENMSLRQRYNLPFPILADSDQAVIQQWGLFDFSDAKQRPIPYPAVLIFNSQPMLAWQRVSFTTRDRPTPGEIVATLNSIT
jgi:peroxiredoxin